MQVKASELSQSQLEELVLKRLESKRGVKQIAKSLGIDEKIVRQIKLASLNPEERRRARTTPIPEATEIDAIHQEHEDVEFGLELKMSSLNDQLRRSAARIKWLERHAIQLEQQNQIAAEIDDREVKTFFIPRPKASNSGVGTAFALASDWHVEEKVTLAMTNGLNEHNLEIMKRKATRYFQTLQMLVDHERKLTKIDDLYLFLLGDFITNNIHDDNLENCLLGPGDALEFAEDLLISGIQFLLKEGKYKSIVIPCCYGNHGRTTHEMRISTGDTNNLEFLMYGHMQRFFSNDKRVHFVRSRAEATYVELYDKTICCSHGHAIRSSGGVGGLLIPAMKKVLRWNATRPAWKYFMGHFHSTIRSPLISFNGSAIGWSPLAFNYGCEFEAPKQQMGVISPDRGFICEKDIYLTESGSVPVCERQ